MSLQCRVKAACTSRPMFELFSFLACSLLFDNEALTSKSVIFKLVPCCVEALHGTNTVLLHPDE